MDLHFIVMVVALVFTDNIFNLLVNLIVKIKNFLATCLNPISKINILFPNIYIYLNKVYSVFINIIKMVVVLITINVLYFFQDYLVKFIML